MQLVATPVTDLPLFRDTLFHFSLSHVCGTCSVYVSVVESYFVHANIYNMLSLLKINAVDSARTFIFLLSLESRFCFYGGSYNKFEVACAYTFGTNQGLCHASNSKVLPGVQGERG